MIAVAPRRAQVASCAFRAATLRSASKSKVKLRLLTKAERERERERERVIELCENDYDYSFIGVRKWTDTHVPPRR